MGALGLLLALAGCLAADLTAPAAAAPVYQPVPRRRWRCGGSARCIEW